MLPPAHRLTDGASFAAAVRGGRRAGSRLLVVHLRLGAPGPSQVGFVTNKAVGNAVVRNRTKRRLRELSREHLAVLPSGADVVVRALPAAGGASYAELGADLERCLDRVLS